ncbi:hypothetical protein [Winogradskyella sp. PG-2]|uniref:hypothetical protein n=1 Tax=Winogradskyella sp. PG-2 TaxID=754409 RepID=UPI000458854B|nr:hypothetical protein [Winogradskyella sp. PG-2]BAO75612.1 hypothetical protein WPG_1382 [Winogradskyella sp. PG-2]
MKKFKKATYAIVFAVICASTFQCASNKEIASTFEQEAPFKVKPVTFQEWYAGIKVGGTGINMFIPITDVKDNVFIQDVYFRNLKSKLVKSGGKYKAILKNPSSDYTFKKAEKPADYPFTLKDDECVVSYSENGQTKYHKIIALNEVAGTYYEHGAPSIYSIVTSAGMASLDDEEEDDN